jgi:hypothetical protein
LRSADRIDEYNQRTGFRGVDPRTGQQIYGAPYGAYAGRQQGTPPNTPPETPPETPKPLYNASDSRAILRGLLSNYGFDPADIESALGTVVGYLDTYDPDIIAEALLPQTELYKRRFSGNQERIKKGMAALSPAEYLAMETSYRQVLDAYKLPAGFYDDPKTDFAYWIANDVSAVEIEARAKTAFEWSNSVDPELKKALKQYYGVGDSEIAAYALDRQRASGIIEKQFRATQIGAEAIRQNIDIGRQFSEQLVDTGVSQQQAREAFDFTAQTKDAFSKLATIEGTDLNTGEIIESQLGMSAEATKKIRGLASQERARFSGQSGSAQTLRQNVSGQY